MEDLNSTKKVNPSIEEDGVREGANRTPKYVQVARSGDALAIIMDKER